MSFLKGKPILATLLCKTFSCFPLPVAQCVMCEEVSKIWPLLPSWALILCTFPALAALFKLHLFLSTLLVSFSSSFRFPCLACSRDPFLIPQDRIRCSCCVPWVYLSQSTVFLFCKCLFTSLSPPLDFDILQEITVSCSPLYLQSLANVWLRIGRQQICLG